MIRYFLSSLKNRVAFTAEMFIAGWKSAKYMNYEARLDCATCLAPIVVLHGHLIRIMLDLAGKCATGFAASWDEKAYVHYWDRKSVVERSLMHQLAAFADTYDSTDYNVAQQLYDVCNSTRYFLDTERDLWVDYQNRKKEN